MSEAEAPGLLLESNPLPVSGRLTATAMTLPEDTPRGEWKAIGVRLGMLDESKMWWIGDWLNFGDRKYGESYEKAADITSFENGTLRNAAWVAKCVEASSRDDSLSFQHHRAVAPLDPEAQRRWLEIAARDRLGVRGLRERIKEEKEDRERRVAALEETDPDLAASVLAGKLELERAERIPRDRKAARERKERERRQEEAERLEPALYCCDFSGFEQPPESVDAIITDPPYGDEALGLYLRLSEFAARVLKPGGRLVVMCGTSNLPDELAALSEHMRYLWTLAYMLPGPNAQAFGSRAMYAYKPVALYVKGSYGGRSYPDVIGSGGREKDDHPWQQNTRGFEELVDRFTEPGELVFDPFTGTGTTAVAALNLKRAFVGTELDPALPAKRRSMTGLNALTDSRDRG